MNVKEEQKAPPRDLAPASEPAAEIDRDGRIRAILGLRGGLLPKVEPRWLRRYYEHLAARLSLPFAAQYVGELGRSQPIAFLVTVVALLEPDNTSGECGDGLMCAAQNGDQRLELSLVDVEVEPDHPNFQFLDDYWYWFWNWRFDPRI
jgi:hypothetical protein